MAGGLVGFLQKVYDFSDYVTHRYAMRLRFHGNRLRHWWLFRGRLDRILVVRFGSIGDVVRMSAVLGRLKEVYPTAQIDVLTSEATAGLIEGHPAVTTTLTLKQLDALAQYDWIINLQTRDPLASFLPPGATYRQVLERLSDGRRARFITGRRVQRGTEVTSTNVVYCVAEMEELFQIALLHYDSRRYPQTFVASKPETRVAIAERLALRTKGPVLALFLGSNSIGCGADEGFRTYSISYLERLISHFSQEFTVAVIGQSQVRNAEELNAYRDILKRHPQVIDLVDRTSLEELVAFIDGVTLLVSTDSSPVHIALARGIPVVGLYVCDATFRMSSTVEQESVIALNSRAPCFYYSWRWRFFCASCRHAPTRAAFCTEPIRAFGVDRIPVAAIDRAAKLLLKRRAAQRDPA